MRNIILIGLLLVILVAAAPAPAQTVQQRQVVPAGGATTTSARSRIVGTIGQPAIGPTQSATSRHSAGFLVPLTSGVSSVPEIPSDYRLLPNYPNPFNPSTTIRFDLPRSSRVRLDVFGLDGRLVAVLLDEEVAAGRRKVVWQGRDNHNRQVASGAYFYRIQAGDFRRTERMMLVK